MSDCYGQRITRGPNKGKWSNRKQYAREALIKAAGHPPFPGAVCRHLCKNDSMCRNGFVCVNPDHLEWGTPSENVLDQDPEMLRERCRKLNDSMTPEERSENSRKAAASPHHVSKLLVTCPHCGKSGQHRAMMRWHFDRCKHRQGS